MLDGKEPGLTVPEQLFLARWKSIDFTGWNEAEVREGFVIDLLHTLGYRKDTAYDLEMEKPLKLAEPFHRIGRKKVDIDYAPSVRKRYYWIVEAKPGKTKKMDLGDLLQVHLYATHPEIQARLVVLTNGWQVRVYDALTLSSFDDALLVLDQGDQEDSFIELREMLGAPSMLRFQRSRMLDIIRGTLAAEVDVGAYNTLAGQLHKLISDGKSIVEENQKKLWMAAWKDRMDEEEDELRTASLEVLFVKMDEPWDGRPASAREFVRRVQEAGAADQSKLIDELAMHYRGRPHNIFRVLALHSLVALMNLGLQVPKSSYVISIPDCVNELALSNMNYWRTGYDMPLCHLDNAACRVAVKLCLRVGTPHFEEMLDVWKSAMTAEEKAKIAPCLEGLVSSTASHVQEIFWRWYCCKQTGGQIWNGIWDLQAIEAELDKLPPKPSSQSLDFYGFQFMGRSWDQLRAGTWNVLRQRPGLQCQDGIDPRVLAFAQSSREEVAAGLPTEDLGPPDRIPQKTMADALEALVIALRLRVAATVGQQIVGGLANSRPK